MKYKKTILLVFVFFLLFSNAYANQNNNKGNETIKILLNGKDIAPKVYPAKANGVVYVIEPNMVEKLNSYYSTPKAPYFIKNSEGKLAQYAFVYKPEPSEMDLLGKIINIRFYTGQALAKKNDSGILDIPLKFKIAKAVKKYGDICILNQEQYWNEDGSYIQDVALQTMKGEYFLHYISLEDICNVFGYTVEYHPDNEVFVISLKK